MCVPRSSGAQRAARISGGASERFGMTVQNPLGRAPGYPLAPWLRFCREGTWRELNFTDTLEKTHLFVSFNSMRRLRWYDSSLVPPSMGWNSP